MSVFTYCEMNYTESWTKTYHPPLKCIAALLCGSWMCICLKFCLIHLLVHFSECCCSHLTVRYFVTSPAMCFSQHCITRHQRIHWHTVCTTQSMHACWKQTLETNAVNWFAYTSEWKLIICHKCVLLIVDMAPLLNWITAVEVYISEPDTSATRHFGTETLRHHKIGAKV